MNPLRRRLPSHTTLKPEQADQLSQTTRNWYTSTVRIPRSSDPPETLTRTVKGLLELQSKWFGLRNASPTAAYEIRRTTPDHLTFQFSLPTRRLHRKLRTHLQNEVQPVDFDQGKDKLPVTQGDTIGGAILTTGRKDWFPLQTQYDSPPINSLATALHRHAMQDTRIVVQILFQPVIGQPLRNWYRNWRTYRYIGYLRKNKEQLWGGRPPTPREKKQADAIEQKAGTTRFHTTIRLLIIDAGGHTTSRIKELAGAFNIFENPQTGQYLDTTTIHTPLTRRIYQFATAIHQRKFKGWHHRFQASIPELAALVSIPSRSQKNIQHAEA